MIPLASCLFVVFCLEVAAFWWMCYVHADWLNMTVNENTFNNPGLGWQPKYSCINPKNNRGHVGYTGPCSRICSSKSGKFKESAPPRGLVQSHLPGLACLVLQLQWKLPPVSFLTTAWILPGFLFGWVFFLEQISMWKLRHEMQVSPRARCDAPQPLSWGSQSHCFPLPSNFLWYWRTICAELSHNKKQLAQLNPLSPWIIVIVELLLKPVY